MLTKALWVVKLGKQHYPVGPDLSSGSPQVTPEALIWRYSALHLGAHVLPAEAPRTLNLTASTGYTSCSGLAGAGKLQQRQNRLLLLAPC